MADWTRRDFLRRSGTATGMVGLGAAGAAPAELGGVALGDAMAAAGPLAEAAVPDEDTIYGWIRQVVRHGVRRPGYPADVWAERWIAGRFRGFGLERVRLEPVMVRRWRPRHWSLRVSTAGGERSLRCFPAPYAEPVRHLELELAAFDRADPAAVAGKAALYDVVLQRVPADLGLSATAPQRVVDPDGTMPGTAHVVPLAPEQLNVMEPSIAAGAAAFIGSLKDYPGDSHHYYVPYDAVPRPIPGVWISGGDGAWLRGRLAAGPVRIRLTATSSTTEFESFNVVGELPGADDDLVIVGSHHDGPWASAVEDGSGISLVLAQASYWAARPVRARPHRLVFVLQAGHMSGGAGLHAFIARHRAELDRAVLEVHLEHAAREFVERDGAVVPSGLAVPRWFFTSEAPRLEAAVRAALVAEDLRRSLILPPRALGGEQPPTDGGHYYSVGGVPIVNFMAAPFYLFDRMDTLDKIDKAHLVPLTRATIRIIEATRGVSPADWRPPH